MKYTLLLASYWVAFVSMEATCSGAAPVFQMRLTVPAEAGNSPPANTDRMTLAKINGATGRTNLEILYVERPILIDQNDLKSATVTTNTVNGMPAINISFTDQGRKRFAEVTRNNLDRRLAIIIDGKVYEAPVIRSEISGGMAVVEGSFGWHEAVQLSNKINQALTNAERLR